MAILSCYVDDRTLAILQRISPEKGMSVEQLAEAAIESAAIAELPGGLPGMHWAPGGGPFIAGGQGLDLGLSFPSGLFKRDDPALGRASNIRPGFYEDDIP